MALCRCRRHSPPDSDRYVAWTYPAGDGKALVCGRASCGNVNEGVIVWLDEDEVQAHERGERVFSLHTNTVRIRVQDFLRHRMHWNGEGKRDPKEEWLKNNTFRCELMRARISEKTCRANREAKKWHCMRCKRNPEAQLSSLTPTNH